ncbi:MAG: hypothetical protein JNK61_08330 [Bacteroidia bacterium]|nr:hypothetical protein [Bacteroidia bacterium]HQV01258.1 hypothetical protein [Bacteroidia bacterium]
MKKLILIACFFIGYTAQAQTVLFNGTPVMGDTVYIKKNSNNYLSIDYVKPTHGIYQFQALMNAEPISCGSQNGTLHVNEKGRYKMRMIWYHDNTAEIFFKKLIYVKYIN